MLKDIQRDNLKNGIYLRIYQSPFAFNTPYKLKLEDLCDDIVNYIEHNYKVSEYPKNEDQDEG